MMAFLPRIHTLLPGLLLLACTQAYSRPPCELRDFTPPPAERTRLESGALGQWDLSLQEQVIRIHDYDGNAWDYYSLQKKPAHGEPTRLLLFLHGFPEFAAAWERELAHFGESVHAVAIDLKGHHYSSAPAEVDEYNFIELGWEMRAIIQCLGYGSATVVGHDFGAAMAWTLGMLHPDVVDGLLIMNAPHPYLFGRALLDPDSDQVERIQYMLYARGTTLQDQLNFTRILFSDFSIFNSDFYRGKRILRLMLENWLPLNRWATMKAYYRAMPLPATEQDFPARLSDFQHRIYSVKVPTRVLWGMADPYFDPRTLDGLPELVKDLVVVRYPDGSHWINHEAEDLHDQIQQLLDDTR